MFVRVYNYNTTELVKAFEAHSDYIRCARAPHEPYVLTCSDDMLIAVDWDKVGVHAGVRGAPHYVMQAAFNPKDTNTFAPAARPHGEGVEYRSAHANFTLEGHEGRNCGSTSAAATARTSSPARTTSW